MYSLFFISFLGLTLYIFPVEVSQVPRAWNEIRMKLNKRCRFINYGFIKQKSNNKEPSQEEEIVSLNTTE